MYVGDNMLNSGLLRQRYALFLMLQFLIVRKIQRTLNFCLLNVLCAKSLLSCLTLCDPMGCSPRGFFVLRIPQARLLELVAISSSRESS